MDKLVPTLGIVLLLVLVFGSLASSWRRRRRAWDALDPLPTLIPDTPRATIDALYLATTRADDPLERVTTRGLAFRARVLVAVHEEGVVLNLVGSEPVAIRRDHVVGAGLANWTIDRASGGDRLVQLRWRLPGSDGIEVDSFFRADDPPGLLGLLLTLVPASTESEAS